jgi:Fe-S cluster assembly iron-binding protein IscA
MVMVTTRAKEALAQIRASANVSDPDIGLRLEAASAGFGLFPDREKPGDQIVEHDGEKVLLIDDKLSKALAGARIDCKRTGDEVQLVIGRAEEPDAQPNNGSRRPA